MALIPFGAWPGLWIDSNVQMDVHRAELAHGIGRGTAATVNFSGQAWRCWTVTGTWVISARSQRLTKPPCRFMSHDIRMSRNVMNWGI
jgi:hypothetical protein